MKSNNDDEKIPLNSSSRMGTPSPHPVYFPVPFVGYSMYPSIRPGDRLLVRKTGRIGFRRGDIVLLNQGSDGLVAHRLVKAIPDGRWITKGDSMLQPDPAPAKLSGMAGRVEAIIRGRRLIRLSSIPRSHLARLYSFLSLCNCTPGALGVRVKQMLTARYPAGLPSHRDPERRLLIGILDGRFPDAVNAGRNLNWQRLRDIACREGVAGIVYSRIKEAELPPQVLLTFKKLYLSIAARNLINLKALEKLEQALQGAPMEVMTLKGATLIDRVYPGMGMRPMSDLDLMVRAEDRVRLESLLADLGYRRDPRIGHEFERDHVVIDLHVDALNTDRIANRSNLFPCGMDPIWESSLPWRDGYCMLRRPDDADNVILLSQHLMKHSFSGLIWLMDIHELLRDRDIHFWTRLSGRSDQLLQRRCVSYSMYLLHKLFGFEAPAGAGFEDPGAALSRLERGLLGARARGESLDRMGPFLALFCIAGTGNRIAFLRETLFPGRRVVREEFRNSFNTRRALFCGFRMLEGLRVISRQLSTIVSFLIKGLP